MIDSKNSTNSDANGAGSKKNTSQLIPLPLDDALLQDAMKSSETASQESDMQQGIRDNLPPPPKMQTMKIELPDEADAAPVIPDRKNMTMAIPDLAEISGNAPQFGAKKNVTMPISELMPEDGEQPATGPTKKTTQINLAAEHVPSLSKEAKRATASIPVIPQTIRLKRPGAVTQPVDLSAAKSKTDLIHDAPTIGRMPDLSAAKMVTARIQVEPDITEDLPVADKRKTSVISTGPQEPAVPETISLKRAGASPLADTDLATSDAEAKTVVKRWTTMPIQLDDDATADTAAPRKTIKVKKSEETPRTVKLARPDAQPAAPGAPSVARPSADAEVEEPHPLFFVLALVAVLIMAGLVYFMAAQAFGPELILPVPASLL